MGFKEDADFARFLSMGAVGTEAVRRDLVLRFDHRVIELERYAMANKVWQTKVKRLRLPDLVCLRCGRRAESRAKTKLGIVLSHSDAPGRAWDGGGMRADDLYSFVAVRDLGDGWVPGRPIYFLTEDLRATLEYARISDRKAISEGSEMTLTWQAWLATADGTLLGVDESDRIEYEKVGGRVGRYHHWRAWPARHLYVDPGDAIVGAETLVAGVVPRAPATAIGCPGEIWALEDDLRSADDADRYSAIRAVGVDRHTELTGAVEEIAVDEEADWRLRIEALAALARLDAERTNELAVPATDQDAPIDQRMEVVFVLTELPTRESNAVLAAVAADADAPSELRAAAVWGLGQGPCPEPDLVVPFAADRDDFVALHAIAGLPELTAGGVAHVERWLSADDDRAAAAAGAVLLRFRRVEELIEAVRRGGRAALWALRALGDIEPAEVMEVLGDGDGSIVEALQPIWIGQDDWLRQGAGEGLTALDAQKVRFDPG